MKKGWRVLAVDDQAVILAALRQMLGQETDFELHCLSDPAQALTHALALEPVVILQDLMMEGIDGISLLRRYRAHPSLTDVPVVMLSAAEEPHTKVEAFRAGANDYVVKLPSALELAARIRYHARAYDNARQRAAAFQALLESRAALEQRQLEVERQRAQLEQQARQLEAVNRELAESALSDALTGLRNRRYLKLFLDAPPPAPRPEDSERRRHGDPSHFSFFLFDLDHFKQINDRHGHDTGDAVLVEVAQRLRGSLRAGDAVLRWGGEEFLVIARGLEPDTAEQLAGRLLQLIGGEPMRAGGRDLRVTCSLGWASWPWCAGLDPAALSHDQIINLADAGAYLSKLEGRNRAHGVLPGPELDAVARLADVSLRPGQLRAEEGRSIVLRSVRGPE